MLTAEKLLVLFTIFFFMYMLLFLWIADETKKTCEPYKKAAKDLDLIELWEVRDELKNVKRNIGTMQDMDRAMLEDITDIRKRLYEVQKG